MGMERTVTISKVRSMFSPSTITSLPLTPGDMIKEGHTRLIAAHIPDARLVFIEGDHFIAYKCPEEFNKAVLAFLVEDQHGRINQDNPPGSSPI